MLSPDRSLLYFKQISNCHRLIIIMAIYLTNMLYAGVMKGWLLEHDESS